jgi:DNA repair photolyase
VPEQVTKLVGIARMAAEAPCLEPKRRVEYFELAARSYLARCDSTRVPFRWTINPYRGCEFGCKYCYARYTHEFMEMRDGLEFEQKIYVKQHAANLLRQELRRVKRGEEIAIGTATDPYQPAEKKFEITRTVLEEMSRHQGLEIGIITKSNMILRDLELLKELSRHNQLSVSITVTTMKTSLARILEPRAPRPDLRVDAIRQLSDAGILVGASCSPVIPGITDSPRDLDALVQALAKAGAKYAFTNPLFLKPCSAAVFMPFLEKEFPQLVASYRQRYADRAYLPKSYHERIHELMKKLRQKHGMKSHYDRYNLRAHPVEAEASQLSLF